MIKNWTNLILTHRLHTTPIVILIESTSLLVPAEPTVREGVDASISIELEIEKKRDFLEMSTEREGTQPHLLQF